MRSGHLNIGTISADINFSDLEGDIEDFICEKVVEEVEDCIKENTYDDTDITEKIESLASEIETLNKRIQELENAANKQSSLRQIVSKVHKNISDRYASSFDATRIRNLFLRKKLP